MKLLHVPPTTKKIKEEKPGIPFSGGAYFRFLPRGIINRWIKEVNDKEKQPVIFYLHPREIDTNQPRLKLKPKDALIHYYGIAGCEKKLTCVLEKNNFDTLKALLKLS